VTPRLLDLTPEGEPTCGSLAEATDSGGHICTTLRGGESSDGTVATSCTLPYDRYISRLLARKRCRLASVVHLTWNAHIGEQSMMLLRENVAVCQSDV
jgi:hypothetical protein